MSKEYKRGLVTGILVAVVLGSILVGLSIGFNVGLGKNQSFLKKISNKVQMIEAYMDRYYIEDIDEDKLAEGVYKGMLQSLDDPYSTYYSKDEYQQMLQTFNGVYCGIGASVTKDIKTEEISFVKPYENGPAYKAGIRSGDVLVSVNGDDVTKDDLSEVVSKIKGEKGTEVTLQVIRDGKKDEPLSFTMKRDDVEIESVAYEMLNGKIGYISISDFDDKTPTQFENAITALDQKGQKGMIIDLRNNGGGSLEAVIKMLDLVLPEGKLLTTITGEGKEKVYTSDAKNQINIPISVLINGNSASASEVFAGAVQDFKTGSLVGTKSFGKGIVQSVFELEGIKDGSAIKLTTSKYNLPSGRGIHKVGLTPDIEVTLPSELQKLAIIPKDQDTQLQAAITDVQAKITK